jgi:hypothetical protein
LPASAAPTPATVVIEVKGAWSRDLMTAQRDQLAKRYLPEAQTDTGIYLVGWYPINLWNESSARRDAAAKLDRKQVEQDLGEQAAKISRDLTVHTHPILLTITRPHAAEGAAGKAD